MSTRVLREPNPEADRWARAVIGAAIEVHRCLGPGYRESVYARALEVEFDLRKIPFEGQRQFPVTYKHRTVGRGRLDYLVANELIVELKAFDGLLPLHSAQVISYLKATGFHLGLLINFRVPVLRQGIRRLVLS